MLTEESQWRRRIEYADLRANHPSSSSLLVRAGSGAPGPSPSVVGSLTNPSLPNGLNLLSVPSIGFCLLVLTGSSRLDQPKSFILSLKDDEAMIARFLEGQAGQCVVKIDL